MSFCKVYKFAVCILQRICSECIRFSAFVVDDDECDRGVHGTNERITRRAYLQGVRFLIALLHTL